MDEYDYIIAGGGTAGCVLANRLSADPRLRVLLLEAGGSGRNFWVEVPLGMKFLLGREKYDWNYQSLPEPQLNDRRIALPRGRMLGGSSAINGMVYVRGHAHDFALWEAAGNRGWGWDDVLPWFRKSECHYQGGDDCRGADGEWKVSDPGVRWPALDSFIEAAVQAGHRENRSYNCGDNEGVSYFEANIASGRRQSTARAFLHPARHRPNLKVETDALVDRVTFAGRRATGVTYRLGGVTRQARARAEVIVTAGAYGSPVILERSGIGAAPHLARLGVAPVHVLPGVGENLQDHWQIRIQHHLKHTRTLNNRGSSWHGMLGLGAQYILTRSGPMTAQPALLTLFARTRAGLPAPDLQVHVSAASYDRVGGPLERYPGITSASGILRPESRGWCHAFSAEPGEKPMILNNFLATEGDRALAVEAVKLVRHIFAQPAMQRYEPLERAPSDSVRRDDEMMDYARRVLTTTFHPAGTCRMGGDPMAVVDDRLRVRGVSGLRVVDASIMPTITSGNTAAPVVMIAEKAAAMIRDDGRLARAPQVAAGAA
ncbi:GMC family oxidoreductase [Halodurantibacterium flavum]|uniref:GMC family oxidoreductase n=1 Tax=Halodurantibacterium flavum TaxID=1382802 RepID=A0ABW4S0J8_9RHOB